jgi:hypothetical protein
MRKAGIASLPFTRSSGTQYATNNPMIDGACNGHKEELGHRKQRRTLLLRCMPKAKSDSIFLMKMGC